MTVKTIYVEITNQCNLNCITCYNRSGANKNRKEISKKQIKDIINLFIPLGMNRFLISGGEPTLHIEFNDIIQLIDEYPKISFGIVTNGTNHNDKLIEFLNTRSNLTLQISLDGSSEDQNSKTRGIGHFYRVIEFIEKIHNPNTIPLLKMVISQNNYHDIENFYELAVSLNCIPEFAFIYKSGNGIDDWNNKMITAQQEIKAVKLIDNLNMKHNIKAFLPLCTNKCSYISNNDNLSFCIKVDGAIQPCQSLYDDKFSIGNVFNFDVGGINKKIENIIGLAQKRLSIDYGCSKCILKSGCYKGCMANAVYLNSDPLAGDGLCEFRKLQFIGYDLKGVISRKNE